MSSDDAPNSSPSKGPITRRWGWWVHLILIGGYFIPTTAMSLMKLRQHPALTGSVRGLLLVCAFELALFALVFGLGCVASRPSRDQLFLRWRPGWWVLPLGMVYSILLRIGIAIVGAILILAFVQMRILTVDSIGKFADANQPDVEKLVDVSALRSNPGYFWLTVTLVSFVVAGLREELWRVGTLAAMRAIWPRTFASRAGRFVAITIIAFAFGAAHLQMGVLAACIAGVLGLFLGTIILVHDSIWPAVLAHGFFDATSMALLPFALDKLRHLHGA